MNKLRKILEDFITEDDKKRKRVEYDLGDTLDKYEKKLKNLRIKKIRFKDLLTVVLIFCILMFSIPSQAVTKCYKDVCVGDKVLVISGLYKGNYANIWDIVKEIVPEDDEEIMRDFYKYCVSFNDGTVTYLYRGELKPNEVIKDE